VNVEVAPKQVRNYHNQEELRKKAFDFLCGFLKDNSECKYLISELEDIVKENMYEEAEGYSRKHIANKLGDDFGDNCLFTSMLGKCSVMTFHRSLVN
jgi:hypothetical protein